MLTLPEKPSIFIQIAAYKDKELLPTLADCLAKAKHPERLTFGICWQHDGTEHLTYYLHDKRFKIISVDWSASRGCCWARSKTQQLYDGEDLTLQIDSHMRFEQDWDVQAVEMLKQCNHPKPILSYYPPPYELKNGGIIYSSYTTPQALTIDRFESGFIPYFGSIPLMGASSTTAPVLGRFIAAGFLFTIGKFCQEVPYNPNIYFLGEETDLAVRSFTKGYNVYHPHKSICYHYFIRKGEPRHWEDHTLSKAREGRVKEDYVTTTTNGWDFLRRLLWEDNADLGPYSLGKERSRRDFEIFAGVNFKRLIIHPRANKQLPPISRDFDWESKIKRVPFNQTITLDLTDVPVLDDYERWYFGLHNKENIEIWRSDFLEAEYLVDRKNTIHIDTTLDHEPKTWTLWPVSKSKGWLTKITRPIV